MVKFLKCNECGKMVIEVIGSACPTKCCGEAMVELVANTTDAANEKHVPVCNIEGNLVTVSVGSVEHPMTPEHYIQFIVLETTEGYKYHELTPEDKPVTTFALAEGEKVVAAYEFCNLHGLWKAE